MQLEHSFTVPAGVEDAWNVLLDIERIAPCMPGASLDTVDGDEFTGSVKVKLGPINLTYKGKAAFIEKDAAAHRAVIDARGKDARGAGTASAKVTATLTQQGDQTVVLVETDLDITGKPAQFGRGVMVDVGNKLIGQFAACLAEEIRVGDGGAADAAAEPSAEAAVVPEGGEAVLAPANAATPAEAQQREAAAVPSVQPLHADRSPVAPAATPQGAPARPRREAEPIDLLEHAGPAVAKRLAPVVAVLLIVLLVIARRRKH
ncbi:MAG: SRPBCC family protein [Jatrophihabitans sp.]|uniref:SRPBCC family protein n=1 Tax=Jatrophihabitans sp. TaxID=1932789 RepID=UPI003F817FC1